MKKKILKSIIIICFLIAIIGFVGAYFLITNSVKHMFEYRSEYKMEAEPTYDYEVLTITTSDNLKLYGELAIPENPKAIVIIAPGWDMTHNSMIVITEYLYENGYGSLNLDLRTRGNSEGEMKGGAYSEVLDIKAGVNHLISNEQTKNIPIATLGVSLGGSTVLNTKDENISSIVSIGAYTDFMDMVLLDESINEMPYGEKIIPFYINLYLGFNLGFKNLNSPLETAVSMKDMPILVVHGINDEQISYEYQGQKIANALEGNPNFEFYPVENGLHFPWLTDYELNDVNYDVFDKIVKFLDSVYLEQT